MKLNFGPWKRIAQLEKERDGLRNDLEFVKSCHDTLHAKNKDLEARHDQAQIKAQVAIDESAEHKKNLLRMATIMAMRGLDKITIVVALLFCISSHAQPVQRQLLTTNVIPYLSSIGATNNGGGNPLVGGSLSVPATLYLTNITANTTLAPFTLSGTLGCGFQLYCSCTGGTDRTLTFPNGCTGSGLGIPPVVTVTNAKAAWFGVLCIPGVNTNVFWSPIY